MCAALRQPLHRIMYPNAACVALSTQKDKVYQTEMWIFATTICQYASSCACVLSYCLAYHYSIRCHDIGDHRAMPNLCNCEPIVCNIRYVNCPLRSKMCPQQKRHETTSDDTILWWVEWKPKRERIRRRYDQCSCAPHSPEWRTS